MSEINHKKFEDTVKDDNGNLHAIPKPGVSEEPHKVNHTAFDGTEEVAPGVLKAVPMPDVEVYKD